MLNGRYLLFNSFAFVLIFLPATLAGFFLIGRHNTKLAALFLAMASLVFYSYWDRRYLLLLLLSATFNYSAGYAIGHTISQNRKWLIAALGIGGDLVLLSYFKYTNFFLASINTTLGANLGVMEIVLPLGISFFTFTQIAFIADVYRGGVREYRFLDYLLFVTYFPHLIAGPILHHAEMMPQFAERKTYQPKTDAIYRGALLFTIGLTKKIVLADTFAAYADAVFTAAGGGQKVDFIASWIGALAYTLQIYFDFSGYTDMAIGSSLMFNIQLPLNFNSPYKAASIIDFWRRWHMTLSRFLRDYLYIPLGGNRKGRSRRYLNLLATMTLGGLWHGANWTFVAWGSLHGAYLIINHAWRAIFPGPRKPCTACRLFGRGLTFLGLLFAWIFFRASTFQAAEIIVKGVCGMAGVSTDLLAKYGIPDSGLRIAATLLSGLTICWLLPNSWQIVQAAEKTDPRYQLRIIGSLSVLTFFLLAINSSRGVSKFIYFNF